MGVAELEVPAGGSRGGHDLRTLDPDPEARAGRGRANRDRGVARGRPHRRRSSLRRGRGRGERHSQRGLRKGANGRARDRSCTRPSPARPAPEAGRRWSQEPHGCDGYEGGARGGSTSRSAGASRGISGRGRDAGAHGERHQAPAAASLPQLLAGPKRRCAARARGSSRGDRSFCPPARNGRSAPPGCVRCAGGAALPAKR